MTVKQLLARINLYLADGLDPDAPVIYLRGNPAVTSEGAVIPNTCGYYAGRWGQREALYLATDVSCEQSPPWDSRADDPKKTWSKRFDRSFGGEN